MSLLNQMLRDLERRREGEGLPADGPLAGLVASREHVPSVSRWQVLGWGAFVLLGSLAWSGGYGLMGRPGDRVTVAPGEARGGGQARSRDRPMRGRVQRPGGVALAERSSLRLSELVTGRAARRERIPPASPRLAVAHPPAPTPSGTGRRTPSGVTQAPRPRPAMPSARTPSRPVSAVVPPAPRRVRATVGARSPVRVDLAEQLARAPDDTRLRARLVRHYLGQGRQDRAGELLLEGLAHAPRDADLARLYAGLLVRRGDLAEALELLERAAPPLRADPDYHALRATLLRRTGRPEAAVEVYHSLVRSRPASGLWWMGLGIALESAHREREALPAFRRALRGRDLQPAVSRYIGERIAALSARRD